MEATSVWDDDSEDEGEGPLGVNPEALEQEEQDDYNKEDEGDQQENDEDLHPPRKRACRDPFNYMWRETDKDDAWVSEDSPGEAQLFITQPDPSPCGKKTAKGKQPVKPCPAELKAPAKQPTPRKTPAKRAPRGRGKAIPGKEAQKNLHIYFDP